MLLAAGPAYAADSLGAKGQITRFGYVTNSSSYTGNFRLSIQAANVMYYSGASGFCAAYQELTAGEIAQLQRFYIHGVEITPRYKTGNNGKRCLVGWK